MAKSKKTEPKAKTATESKRGRVENLRPFQPGQSGNPGGQPKGLADVRKAARTYTQEAIETLAKWMRDDNPKASIPAAVALLNRGWGMPQQTVKATVNHIREMTDAELTEFLTGEHDEIGDSEGTATPQGNSGLTH